MPEISEKSFQILRSYLEDHDEDIVNEVDDFGDLQEVYRKLCVCPFCVGWTKTSTHNFCQKCGRKLKNA